MNEQEITSAVQAVLEQMKEAAPQHTHKHVCQCKKHQMTLKLANALIEKVKAEAATGGCECGCSSFRQGGQTCSRPVYG